ASEQVNLFQLRKQARARIAARHALHLIDGQEFTRIDAIRVELVAAVEVAGNDQHVAADAGAACRGEPIGTAALDELDESKFVTRKAAAKYFLFVRRIDGDRAHRFLISAGVAQR